MELLDVYNEKGEKTGKVVERSVDDDSFVNGERIAVAIIYIENDKHEFLIQKTSKQKGNIYSATAGHVLHNEKPIETIIREVKEELGIDISNEDIVDLGCLVVDFPVRFMFYLKKNIDLNELVLQKDEVQEVMYMSEKEIRTEIEKGTMNKDYVQSIMLDLVLDYSNKK